ncbi:MAG: DUF4864 domain-containing protein [Candidatus Manganitrophus sp. SB1]|nr:DUF4864 domain-containing protein [Candidatus Manganitrophus morganii]
MFSFGTRSRVACWKILCLSLFSLSLFPAHPSAAADPTDLIQSVIRQQMKAFNEDDYATARTFASEGLRQRFSKERFEKMVKSGYPQIAKSHLVSFGEILFSDDTQAAVATVHVTGKDRVTVIARYLMVLEGNAWKINGVMILEEIQPIRLSREVKFPLCPADSSICRSTRTIQTTSTTSSG